MDDEDAFLYGEGDSVQEPAAPGPLPIQYAQAVTTNGVVKNLEAQAKAETSVGPTPPVPETAPPVEAVNADLSPADIPGDAEEDEEEDMDAEDSDDDIEFILERPKHVLDNRRPEAQKPAPYTSAPGHSLATDYTPLSRSTAPTKPPEAPGPSSSTTAPTLTSTTITSLSTQQATVSAPEDDGVDPTTLPIVTALASAPSIDPHAVGQYEGRPVIEVDLSALADKAWRRPGSDLSDWFNYGFDEISWEAYCYRRREMGEAAALLKVGVVSFAGIPEEQILALPPDVRQMVMASANTVMSGGGMPNGGMMQNMQGGMQGSMQGGPMMGGMNPMMPDMNGMGGGMGNMGMNGPMGGHMAQMNMGGMPMNSGMGHMGPGNMMGAMGMNGPAGDMSGGQSMMGQHNISSDTIGDGSFGAQATPEPGVQDTTTGISGPDHTGSPAGRGTPSGPGAFRGNAPFRGGRGAFPSRGRGNPRVPSPLPPNVPTGPKNQNKYKDRDNNGPAVGNLDYGGGGGSGSVHDDDRSRRKRRGSPDYEPREPKRR